jgi:hypothetical protein
MTYEFLYLHTDVMILKIYSPEKSAKNWRFLTQNKALIITWSVVKGLREYFKGLFQSVIYSQTCEDDNCQVGGRRHLL